MSQVLARALELLRLALGLGQADLEPEPAAGPGLELEAATVAGLQLGWAQVSPMFTAAAVPSFKVGQLLAVWTWGEGWEDRARVVGQLARGMNCWKALQNRYRFGNLGLSGQESVIFDWLDRRWTWVKPIGQQWRQANAMSKVPIGLVPLPPPLAVSSDGVKFGSLDRFDGSWGNYVSSNKIREFKISAWVGWSRPNGDQPVEVKAGDTLHPALFFFVRTPREVAGVNQALSGADQLVEALGGEQGSVSKTITGSWSVPSDSRAKIRKRIEGLMHA